MYAVVWSANHVAAVQCIKIKSRASVNLHIKKQNGGAGDRGQCWRVSVDRKATVTRITALYSRGEQKSISEHINLEADEPQQQKIRNLRQQGAQVHFAQIGHVKIGQKHHLVTKIFDVNINTALDMYDLCDLLYCTAGMWLADWITVWKNRCTYRCNCWSVSVIPLHMYCINTPHEWGTNLHWAKF